MIKEKILKELEVFKDILFVENTHSYYLNNKKFNKSVTRLIHDYTQPFDEQGMAEKVALKEGKTVTEILDKWHYERDYACDKGNFVHSFIQDLFNKKDVLGEHEKWQTSITQALKFYEDYKDKLITIKDELIVGDLDFNLCGSIDNMFYNTETKGVWLIDYKTNKEIKTKGFANAKMKIPLNHLDDCNYNHYQLQLNIYKYLLEKNTDLKVQEMKLIHFDEQASNYKIYEVNDLQNEVKKILEIRREKNMKSIPVLIIGKSGSGKSTSLRNLKPEEFSLVNVLKKPLPFKNKINGYEERKDGTSLTYEDIKTYVESTPKKIVIIDDAGYLMTQEFMQRSKETGYTKFTDIAKNFYELIESIRNLDGDKRVYLIMHEEKNENGDVTPKTVGKLLDNQVCIEGIFTVVLRALVENGNYIFRTKTTGQDVVKTPLGMFEVDEVENDLAIVDKAICDYYEIKKEKVK